MDDHACGFVDDDQIVVFVDHGQGDGFGLRVIFLSQSEGQGEGIAFCHAGFGVGDGKAVLRHRALSDHLHQA